MHYPLTMVIPPERARVPGLTLPHRQWKRLPDGSIEVVFNSAEELHLCVEATRAVRRKEQLL